MDKTTALRVEKVKLGLQATEKVLDIWTRLCIAAIAVCLTLAGTLVWGLLVRQLSLEAAALGGTIVGSATARLLLELRRSAALLRRAGELAVNSIDILIAQRSKTVMMARKPTREELAAETAQWIELLRKADRVRTPRRQ